MTVGAGQSAIDLSQITDTNELKKVLGKKKKRRRSTGPIWEQGWFLTLCLAVVCGGIAWALLPPSEEQLYARALPLIQSDDPVQWQQAQDLYLNPLLQRFPQGRHAEEARMARDRLEMHRTERGIETRLRLGQDPKNEAERLFLQARAFERFGDNVTAREQYRAMIELLKDRDQDRSYLHLAKRQLAALENAGDGNVDRKQIVNDALKKAREQFLAGQTHAAEETWRNIIKLYDGKAEFADEVAEARAGRAGRLNEAQP
jgi:hypothetical protein